MLFLGLGDRFFCSGIYLEFFSRTLVRTGDFYGVNICGIFVTLEFSGTFLAGDGCLSVLSNGFIAFLELTPLKDCLTGLFDFN